jgi:hypothetical protein
MHGPGRREAMPRAIWNGKVIAETDEHIAFWRGVAVER